MRAILDKHLQVYDLGHAHFRALYFILHRPGMSVGDLLTTLKVTNQSANRVLSQLLDKNLIESRIDENDRRKRRLFTTNAGATLTATLEKQQLEIMAKAYRKAGPQAVGGFWAVLNALSQD
ncbi:MAG: MarR family transcriptional regulator [Sphingomonadales bacterium]